MEDELFAFLAANLLAPFLQSIGKKAGEDVWDRNTRTTRAPKVAEQLKIPPYATDWVYTDDNLCYVVGAFNVGRILASSDMMKWINVRYIPAAAKLVAYIYQTTAGDWIMSDGLRSKSLPRNARIL